MEQNQVFKLNDDEVFILDRSQSKRIAQLKIDRNIEIYSAVKGKYKVVEWEHQYVIGSTLIVYLMLFNTAWISKEFMTEQS